MSTAYAFLSGGAAMLAVVVALFFLRYWRRTRDRFFLLWAVSFVLMAVQWSVAVVLRDLQEAHPNVYLIRLAAFLLIIVAIVDKNRGGGGRRLRDAAAAHAARTPAPARLSAKAAISAVGVATGPDDGRR